MGYISTGCGSIDKLFFGGICKGAPTLIYGVPMVGKTFLSLQTSVRCTMEGKKVLYLDADKELIDDISDTYITYFKHRWSLDDDVYDMIKIRTIPNLFELGNYFGIKYTVIQEKSRISCITKFPKRKTKKEQKESQKAEDWLEYTPIWKELSKGDYGLVVIDSIAVPVKGQWSFTMQNLPARQAMISPIFDAAVTLASEFNIGFIITNHGSQDPQWRSVKPWGGDDMIYRVKRVMGILNLWSGHKEDVEKYGEGIRKIIRYRYPAQLRDEVKVILAKNIGYTDLPDLKRGRI